MRAIEFVLPFLLPSLNSSLRQHWADRHRQAVTLHDEVMCACGGPRHYPRPPYARARVTVIRVSTGALDPDNAAASVKILLDVLKLRSEKNPLGLNFLTGDSPDRLELVVRQQKAAHRANQATVVKIEELPA